MTTPFPTKRTVSLTDLSRLRTHLSVKSISAKRKSTCVKLKTKTANGVHTHIHRPALRTSKDQKLAMGVSMETKDLTKLNCAKRRTLRRFMKAQK
jgi:hypothetical protein